MQIADHSDLLSGTRILVTGATGFLGSNMCRRLSALDVELHATSREARPKRGDGPVWWQVDTADLDAARSVFSAVRPDIVVHLAGLTGARADRDLVLPAFHSLATSTVNVLTLATDHACRRVILFGSLNEPVPSMEFPTPASPYAAGKWIASAYGRMFYALYGTPVVNLRPFMAYGPAQARAKLIPSVILSVLKGENPRLSSGRVRGDWIYIDDVLDAFIVGLTTPGIEGRMFDLGTGRLTSQRELVQTLLRIMKTDVAAEFGAIPDRPLEQEIVADTAPALEQLGWSATTSLEEGLRRTAAWYAGADGRRTVADAPGAAAERTD